MAAPTDSSKTLASAEAVTGAPPLPPMSQVVVTLPSWTDTPSVVSYLTTVVGLVFAIITGVHPGYTEPLIVQSLLPAVGAVIAGGAQIVNIITHRTTTAKIAMAAIGDPGTVVTLK